ncbi:MAG: hypothetical protein IT385_16180 [Deltaproteobacteria bacterium]|nr:hypothetical protein [Deltaproteobacteria bacterium]
MRPTLLRSPRVAALGFFALALAACPPDSKTRLGGVCQDGGECASGLCLEQQCMDPSTDLDGDTLTNSAEGVLGTSPTHVDSDEDGVSDPDEVGADLASPLDRDGDGRIDALESRLADADGDCIPDEEDPDDATADPAGCSQGEDCEALRQAGESSGDFTIDPDGEGGLRPFRVTCDMDTERGGWTSLVEAYLPHSAEAAHEYLIVKGDVWYRTPPVTRGWSWDGFLPAPGTWLFRQGDGDGGHLCPASPPAPDPAAVGFGCAPSDDAAIWLTLAAPTDAALGRVRRCLDDGGATLDDCDDGWQVFARRMRCPRDPGTSIGDGDFARVVLDDTTCWQAQLSSAALESAAPPSGEVAPALSARSLAAGSWSAVLTQRVELATGFTYRIGAWTRATGGGIVGVKITDGEATVFDSSLRVAEGWGYVERSFTAPRLSLDTELEVFLGGDTDGVAHLDSLIIEPLGPNGCASEDDVATRDRGFDHGLACWDLSIDPSVAVEAQRDDDAEPPPGEASPVLRFERPALDDESLAFILQEGFSLPADRAWRLEGWMKSDVAEVGRVQLGVDLESDTVDLGVPLTPGTWTRLERDFVAAGSSGMAVAWLHVKVGPTAGGALLIDGVGVRDLGPHPCAPSGDSLIRDPGFTAGTACWLPRTTLPGLATFARDPVEAPEGGAPPSLVISDAAVSSVELWDVVLAQRGIALEVSTEYEVTFAARAESQTSLLVVVTNWDDFTQHASQAAPIGTTWQTHRVGFVASKSETDAVLEIQLGQTRSRVWLDDVDIRQVR